MIPLSHQLLSPRQQLSLPCAQDPVHKACFQWLMTASANRQQAGQRCRQIAGSAGSPGALSCPAEPAGGAFHRQATSPVLKAAAQKTLRGKACVRAMVCWLCRESPIVTYAMLQVDVRAHPQDDSVCR